MFYRTAGAVDGLKRGLRADAQGGWRRAGSVRVSATCGLEGGPVPCPPVGLDARPDVLEVGRPVQNTIRDHFVSAHAVLSSPLHGEAPEVLAGPLPVGDKSPAFDTRDRGLHRWGQAGALESFGDKAYDDAVCPWYVE